MRYKKQKIKDFFKPAYYWIFFRYFYLLEIIFSSRVKDPKNIPIIINNFNRLTYLKLLIASLERRGYFNIYIIDNASSYPPLLEYYKQSQYDIFYLRKNIGHLALWKSNIYKKFKNNFYVYTDPDLVLPEGCPDDFMELFLKTLKKYKFARKVGFSLKIDNLPECFSRKREVIDWEIQYFQNKINDMLYRAPIDTTFALYRPRTKGGSNSYVPMYRTASPYEIEHLPWYVDSNNLTSEDKYYLANTKTSTMWTELEKLTKERRK